MTTKPSPTPLADAFTRAVEHHQADELEQAEPLYLAVLKRCPDYARAWTNYGALLRKKGRYAAAIAAHRRALELAPGDVSARNNLANALAAEGQYAEAEAIRRELAAAEPQSPLRERDLCAALRGLGRHEEVIARIDAAEAAGYADGECLLQRSLSRLMLGNYAGGFADFELRYCGDEVSLPNNAPWPRWQGEPLAGKKLVVTPEQGFGDAILTSRFLPGLKALGAEVHMQVKKPLRRLFANIEGLDHMLGDVSIKQAFDYYSPNMSLPHLVGLADGKPPPLPRLTIPEDSRKRAAALVAPFKNRFRIGVVWTGSLTYKSNNRRSTTPEAFLGLAQVPGVQLFSLYKGDAHQAFLDSGMVGLVVDACGADRDFADTAAIIDAMDLLICTDTAVVHVGASLGKPVWNLLSHESFWLYGLGESTDWYPSMRLFRQPAQGDWEGLFARVQDELRRQVPA